MTRVISLLTILGIICYFFTVSGCQKELSCETCFASDTIPRRDTVIIKKDTTKIDSTINFPFCSTCDSNQAYVLSRWSFRNYNSFLCGNIYSARLDSGHNIIIDGIQDCTQDTAFTITGRFPAQTFSTDQSNIPASYANFLLYAPGNVILAVAGGVNGTPLTMNVVLDTFNYTTGIASFRFFGYAYTNKGGSSYITGDSSYISSGRFKAKVR
jgi:hypothetical protein